MTFNDLITILQQANRLYEITQDVMLLEAVRVLSPALATPDRPLDFQQQVALQWVARSVDHYEALFGYPPTPNPAPGRR